MMTKKLLLALQKDRMDMILQALALWFSTGNGPDIGHTVKLYMLSMSLSKPSQ